MLAEADLSTVKVRTDTVKRHNSKEAIESPMYAFCAHCFKVSTTHQRCSGCTVAYYCSAECQKKGWKLHKTECKDRQKEQEEWDAMVADYSGR
ncbi:hypothetical protein P389DRAFT_164967 [Cystobasidium minutum MCA 4210]|uniref:uncharacterized protein n=1 Tax=Cystobasidium minutum MCA 4210 TaxID=1397322 RepID=UPI0034CD82A8|eukprot:jgi/Rhomi1/164967/fgenesh1_kg.1_\